MERGGRGEGGGMDGEGVLDETEEGRILHHDTMTLLALLVAAQCEVLNTHTEGLWGDGG